MTRDACHFGCLLWSRPFRVLPVAGALLVVLSTHAFGAIPLHRYAGITCSTSSKLGAVACVRRDGRGLVVGISGQLVEIEDRGGALLFAKRNFGSSSRRASLNPWFAFDGVRCGVRPPSTVECLRADGVGYEVTISTALVSVVRLPDLRSVYRKRNTG